MSRVAWAALLVLAVVAQWAFRHYVTRGMPWWIDCVIGPTAVGFAVGWYGSLAMFAWRDARKSVGRE